MLTTSWIKRFANRLRSAGRNLALHPATSRPVTRLSFERLEDRTLLATLTVNSLGNAQTADAVLSLREAILAVNDGDLSDGINFLGRNLTPSEMAQVDQSTPLGTQDVITFDASLASQAVALGGSPLPAIIKDVQIVGNSDLVSLVGGGGQPEFFTLAPKMTIDGQNLSNIFAISGATTDVSLVSLNIINGRDTTSIGGGAVKATSASTGMLQIVFSNLSGNTVAAPASGSGGAVNHTGQVVAAFSNFTGNSTYAGFGGAIYSKDGSIASIGSTFSGNSANIGGALATNTGDIGVILSTISGNSAGGGIVSSAGGIFTFDGDIAVQRSTITGNMAPVAGGIGPFANNSGESLTIQDSIVAGNLANVTPDFYAPGGGAANLMVTNSLIGRSDNTSLTPTFGNTPDAMGNFIGGNGGAGIDPMLGPLQDNGGLTFTHALLPGSLAIDSGSNTFGAALNDQRGPPFLSRFNGTDDMGAFEFQPLTIAGTVANVAPGAGDDRIIFRTANNLLRITTPTDTAIYRVPSNITQVNIDGGAGNDFINALGSAGVDQVTGTPFGFQLEQNGANPGAEVTGQNLEVVILDGQGGADTATLTDSAGNDKAFIRPTNAVMFAADISYQTNVFGFQVTALATTGNDLARYFDSPGNDTLTTNPTTATFAGPGFSHTAQNFDITLSRSLQGNDTVNAAGSAGNDAFTGRNGFAVMTGSGFNHQFDSFETVNANGGGGTDIVRFIGGPLNDTLNATSFSSATFTSGGSTLNTTSFERLVALAGGGANNVATLTDSAGNDIFNGGPGSGELSGAGFFQRTTGFNAITIRGVNGGVNTLINNGINYPLIQVGTWV